MKLIFKSKSALLLGLFMYISNSFAQQKVILRNKISGQEIANASYQLGTQKGKSEANGAIIIQNNQNYDKLIISHILYEKLELDRPAVQHALEKGFLLLVPLEPINLNPVTVYALKSTALSQTTKLGNVDWVQHDAAQVLQQIPGFSVIKKSGSFGFDPVFRGLKLDQLNILTDGIMASHAACPNRMDPPSSQVLVSQADQIQILKGPHSFRYGPAMGAVINFITTSSVFSDSLKVFGRLNSGFESNGKVYRTEGLVGLRGKKVQISGIASYSEGDDYKDGNEQVIPAQFSRGSVGLNTAIYVKKGHQLDLSVAKNFARNTDFPVLMMDLLSDDTWLIKAQYKISGEKHWYDHWITQVFSSAVDHEMGNRWRASYANMQTNVKANTRTLGARTEFSSVQKNSQIFVGGDIKQESADGDRVRKMITGPMAGRTFVDTLWQDAQINRAGIFGEWYHQIGHYNLSMAARLDVVNAQANNPSAKFSALYGDIEDTDLNASFSLGLNSIWGAKWQIGLWIGRGVRSASITERYINSLPIGMDPYEMLGNPELKPEANNQLDISVNYKAGATSIQWSGFTSLVTNQISSVINPAIAPRFGAPGVRSYINVKEALLYGFELNWQQQLFAKISQQLSIAYTYGKDNMSGLPLPEIAPMDFRYRLDAKMANNKAMPYLQVRHALRQNRIAEAFGERKTPAFTTIDMGLKVEPMKNLQFTVAINNVQNKAYREHLSRYIQSNFPLNSIGRNLVFMAHYSF